MPVAFVNAQVLWGDVLELNAVTLYALPLGIDIANVKVPSAVRVKLSVPLSCSVIGPELTMPLMLPPMVNDGLLFVLHETAMSFTSALVVVPVPFVIEQSWNGLIGGVNTVTA